MFAPIDNIRLMRYLNTKIDGICSKVNREIYSSSPIQARFWRYIAEKFKMPKIAKGHNSGKN